MKLTPNFTEAFAPMADGIYQCKILEVEGKTSKAGNRYLNWKLETPEKSTLYYSTVVEGKGAGMLKHFVRCVLDPEYDSGPIETDDFLGKHVAMELKVEDVESKGKMIKAYRVANVWRVGEDPNSDINF